jgi:tRNA dimethylallyltransferase
MLPDVIIITGSTATGKTDLGVALAQQLNTDVISCDSQLVYKGLDIGTAKPTAEEQQGIPHFGMDLVAPDLTFSAAMYQEAVLPLLLERLQQSRPAILVGGTGFYLRQLLEERPQVEVPPNPALRASLEAWAKTQNHPYALHERLKVADPLRASQLYPQDLRRILRALEIIEATGQAVPQEKLPSVLESAWCKPLKLLWVGLTHSDVAFRYAQIERRIEVMLEQGWLSEVETLIRAYGESAHALQVAYGYPELCRVLKGDLDLEEAKAQIAINVRQYARRQKVWFNRHEGMHWCDVSIYATTQAKQDWVNTLL